VGTQLIGQPLGAQGGKDPLDGVRVRRGAPAGGVVADTQVLTATLSEDDGVTVTAAVRE